MQRRWWNAADTDLERHAVGGGAADDALTQQILARLFEPGRSTHDRFLVRDLQGTW